MLAFEWYLFSISDDIGQMRLSDTFQPHHFSYNLYEAWWRHILLIDWGPSAWRLLRWATYCGSALMQFKPNLSTFIYEAVWKRLNFVQEWVFHAWWLIDTWWYTVNWVGSVFKVEGQSTYNRSFKFSVSNRKISITRKWYFEQCAVNPSDAPAILESTLF